MSWRCPHVYVSNISTDITPKALIKRMMEIGPVPSWGVCAATRPNMLEDGAMFTFTTAEHAMAAVRRFNGQGMSVVQLCGPCTACTASNTE